MQQQLPKKVTWHLYIIQRKIDKNKKDIYYCSENTNNRLRSTTDISQYCQKNNKLFDPYLINFSSKVNFQGAINSKSDLFPYQVNLTEHPTMSATNSDDF